MTIGPRAEVTALLGDTPPASRIEAAFDAVDSIDDPAIFIGVADRASALARLDSSLPLAGLTFAVKNNIDVEGFDTTAGCPSYGYRPERSAPVVQRLLDAGGTCLGVTNLDQFATGLVGTRSPYGVARNAVDHRLVPGGSSSGSAVAVARGVVDVAFGTDTAGSGRVPAAQNRIVGVKPTRGLLPMSGVVPAVRSIDCASVFARTVGLASLAVSVCTGFDPTDPWSRRAGPGPLTMPSIVVGVPSGVRLRTELDRAAWTATVERLGALDLIEVIEVDIEAFIEAGELLYGGPWVAERYAAVGEFLETRPADADPIVAGIIRSASEHSAVAAYEAGYRLARLARRADEVWSLIDVLMTPTTSGVATLAEVDADPVGRNSELGLYTNWVNLLDQCAVAIPGADRADGWPFGVSIVGPTWADALVTDVSARMCGEVAAPAPPFGTNGGIDLVVVGAHLRGQPLNWQLTDHGGRFMRSTTTSSTYRLYALGGTTPPKPALVGVGTGAAGAAIEVEVWRLPTSELGAFSQYIPAPLGLGRVELADGSLPTGFIAEPRALDGATDITHHGGWRAYLAAG